MLSHKLNSPQRPMPLFWYEKSGLGRLRWLDNESPAPEHIAATTNRELALLNKGPKTLGDQLGVSGPRLYGGRSGESLGERPFPGLRA